MTKRTASAAFPAMPPTDPVPTALSVFVALSPTQFHQLETDQLIPFPKGLAYALIASRHLKGLTILLTGLLLKLQTLLCLFTKSSSSYASFLLHPWDIWLFVKKEFLSKEMDVITFAKAITNGTDRCTGNVGPQKAQEKHFCGSLKTNLKWSAERKLQLSFVSSSNDLMGNRIRGLGFKDVIATLIRLEIGSRPLGLNQTDRTHFRQNRCVFWYHSGIEPGIYWLVFLYLIFAVLRSCLFSQAVFNWKNWIVTWLHCSLTERLLHWAVTWLNGYLTELLLDWTVTWLNCYVTELLLDWTVTWLNCYLTELLLYWAVTWRNCYLTELLLDWAVTLLSCYLYYLTELLLDWTVTWLNGYLTERLLYWAVTWLNCYLTELLLDWTVTVLHWYLTEL